MNATTKEVLDTQDVANRLVKLCGEGRFNEAVDELFADKAISIEPVFANLPVITGLQAIQQRGKEWEESVVENHGGYVDEPVVAGNHFAVVMGMDVTTKDGKRSKMDEVCVYKVDNGKIVSQQFFY